jgi:hypothetical protein
MSFDPITNDAEHANDTADVAQGRLVPPVQVSPATTAQRPPKRHYSSCSQHVAAGDASRLASSDRLAGVFTRLEQLQSARPEPGTPTWTAHYAITGDFKTITHQFLVARQAADDGPLDALPWLSAALMWRAHNHSPDPVLRMSLADYMGLREVRDGWADEAREKYLLRSEEYDKLLGDLVPADFRESALEVLSLRAYVAGTHPTAADDWPHFQVSGRVRKDAPTRAVPTGLPTLDALLGGGLRGGLTFLGGPTGVGKTSLATFIARAGLRGCGKLAVLYLEFDMAKEDVYGQILAAESEICERSRPAESAAPGNAASTLDECSPVGEEFWGMLERLRVLDRRNLREIKPAVAQTWQSAAVEWLVGHVKSLRALTGAETVLVVLDSFQRLDVPGVADDQERDTVRLDLLFALMAATRTNIHPAGMPVLALSKIPKNRGGRLGPDDLHGDSDLGSRASAVLFLEKDPGRKPAGPGVTPLLVNVAKGRDGTTRGDLPVDFDYRVYGFREVPPAPAAKPPGGEPAGKPPRKSGRSVK